MNFSELTIVCITYGRPNYVGRLIKYWQIYFKDAKIYILDGSNQKLEDKYLNMIKEKNTNYIHMQNASIFKRYTYIKNILKTKYFQLVADDELFTSTGIKNCLDFLENNPAYSSCCGKMILFTPLLKKEVFAFSPYNLYSNEDSVRSQRVKSWLEYSQPNTIYSITRSENYIKILNECLKINEKIFSKPQIFFEELVEIGLVYQGKTKIINELMWLRSIENERIGFEDDDDRPEMTVYNENHEKKKFFFDNVIQNYLKNFELSGNDPTSFDLKSLYSEWLELTRKNIIKNNSFFINLFKLNFIKKYLFKIIPKNIKKRIRFHLKLNGPEIISFLQSNNKGIIFDKKEILEIKRFILDFHNDKFYK